MMWPFNRGLMHKVDVLEKELKSKSELIEEDFDNTWKEFSPDVMPSFGIHWGKDTELLLKVAQRLLDLEKRVSKDEENVPVAFSDFSDTCPEYKGDKQ